MTFIRKISRAEGECLQLGALWEVPYPPAELYIEGSREAIGLLRRLPRDGLAIVGTREPTLRSSQLLERWIRDLRGTNLIILSGLARGIDTVAHRSALRSELPTIAILGCGLDILYPQENMKLREEIIASRGLIITEYSSQHAPQGFQFLHRNRLIAGWSSATWVAQAGARSGALNTAKWAQEQNRTLFVTPTFPEDPSFLGNQRLLDDKNGTPVWGTHSLGVEWIELAARKPPVSAGRRRKINALQLEILKSPPAEPADILDEHIKTLTLSQGGAHFQQLLDWSTSREWTPQTLLTAISGLVSSGRILEKNGLLLKNL